MNFRGKIPGFVIFLSFIFSILFIILCGVNLGTEKNSQNNSQKNSQIIFTRFPSATDISAASSLLPTQKKKKKRKKKKRKESKKSKKKAKNKIARNPVSPSLFPTKCYPLSIHAKNNLRKRETSYF